jgi:hypothetical protein
MTLTTLSLSARTSRVPHNLAGRIEGRKGAADFPLNFLSIAESAGFV